MTGHGSLHGPGHGGKRGQVEHAAHVPHRLANAGLVPEVALEQLDVAGDPFQVHVATRGEVVEHPHALALCHQLAHDIRADKTAAAGYQAGHV